MKTANRRSRTTATALQKLCYIVDDVTSPEYGIPSRAHHFQPQCSVCKNEKYSDRLSPFQADLLCSNRLLA
jgi:hypothetical protein